MPRYDYICPTCGNTKEEVRTISSRNLQCICCKCGIDMNRKEVYTLSKDWFRPHWNENLGIDPVYVESKTQYKKECKKRGLTARCLL